ncbi:cache domain-containing protein [Azospirillum picis]|uniref:Signal transduction histidine kinase n=1 Tax=Azospirillum picis TaxID=488438 RepID=A0ABU0MPD9_9PROT|nr:cache domain-containing protein [Azospirillum picis]MBP2301503.1 signal transduction histidine kinase [Azospirillum picis]MDQ0535335.1 signal transduction histidine kinase [Azospirillum picis]
MSKLRLRFHRQTLLTVLPVLLLLVVIAFAAGAPARTRGSDAEALRMMDRAQHLLERIGAEAAPEAFAGHDSAFIDRDLYPMLLDDQGTMIAHGWTATLNGSDLKDLRDVDGKAFIREALDGSAREGSTDVTYQWIDPLTGQVARKTIHARRLVLNGRPYMLAVGVYR